MYELNDNNRDEYIPEIKEYLSRYLLEGTPSFHSDDIINFFGLGENELDVIKTAHFLISPQVRELFDHIPILFRNLSHSTSKDDVEYHGVIHGNINWNKTIKTRYSRGFNDKSLFVCSPPFKHYDLDENRILKFLFKEIIFLYENILKFKNSNKESVIDLDKLNSESEKWFDIAEDKYRLSRLYIHNIHLGEVSDLDFISADALKKAQNHRNPIYHDVAKVFKLYEKLFINEDTKCLKDLVKNQLIVASDNNTLFEIYIFFKLISKLEDKSVNDSFKMHLYFNKKLTEEQVSADLDECTVINVFYQYAPKDFRNNSRYLKMNKEKRYHIDVRVRRPDIIVKIIKNEKIFYRIIEVKNASKCEYMRDSFYKMFGYIYDFSLINDLQDVNFTENMPFVLVNWNGSKIDEKFKEEIFNQELVFFNKNEFLKNMDKLLEI